MKSFPREAADMYDCIIIGGGIAGLTAAIYASRAGLKTVVIEREQTGSQALMADKIENYPGFSGSGYELICKAEEQALSSGAEIIYDNIEDVSLEGSVKTLKGENETYSGKTVIIAVGASHKRAGFQGEEEFFGRGVSVCALCDGAFFEEEDAAVIGGGNTAAEEALYLSGICKKVYILHRRDKLRADFTLRKRLESRENIEILYNTVPIKVKGEESVKALVTNRGELSLKGIFTAVGLSPNTEIFKGKLELDEKGYIKVNNRLETNMEGVYAAGDCRVKDLRQLITAAADGAAAEEEALCTKH